MQHTVFHRIFKASKIPAIVCRNVSRYPIIYANPSAILQFYWQINTQGTKMEEANVILEDLFGSENKQTLQAVVQTIMVEGGITGFRTTVRSKDADPIPIIISGNQIDSEEGETFVVYLQEDGERLRISAETVAAISANSVISVILKECFQTIDVDEAINQILRIAGQYLNVSRSYIIEDLFNQYTRNTYEWCNEGVKSVMQYLKSIKKSDHNYAEIVEVGKFIYDDTKTIPEGVFRDSLEMQNIKAIAILPLYRGNQPIGYVGFDDCNQTRKWTKYEIQILEQISSILASLLEKREVLAKQGQNLKALETILDHFDHIIYAADIRTNQIVFANRFLANILGKDPKDVIGKPCWEVLQLQSKLCEFCPLIQMLSNDGKVFKREYIWEWEDRVHHKWYQVKDFIIKWFDDSDVHLQIATDITDHKEHEKILEYYASTDALTGLLNRKWGLLEIQELMEHRQEDELCISFIDVDGLKKANDNLGHNAGDEMLRHIVRSIRTSIRRSDVMCRWGGDEFVGMLHCNETQARKLMQRVITKLEKMNHANQYPYQLSISFGLVSVNENLNLTMEELIAIADSRMYEQKMGKNKRESSAMFGDYQSDE
ncbi:MAG: diguanylate cyclase [Evtepia sp.]|jgi:diguanylate cyclase (GGDEF)-like protein|nr:diguanylate cyclase [Evtepia sp.]